MHLLHRVRRHNNKAGRTLSLAEDIRPHMLVQSRIHRLKAGQAVSTLARGIRAYEAAGDVCQMITVLSTARTGAYGLLMPTLPQIMRSHSRFPYRSSSLEVDHTSAQTFHTAIEICLRSVPFPTPLQPS